MKRDQYEKELHNRQKEHLEKVMKNTQPHWQPCMHDKCNECYGTGVKIDGTQCVHSISCPCPKCNPLSL